MTSRKKQVTVYGGLALATVFALFPLLWMLSVSLMEKNYALQTPPPIWPGRITLEHYRVLFERLNVARYLFNSTLVALLVTVLSLLINSMAGYAFAKLRFRGRARLFNWLLAGLVIPGQVAVLPLFLLLKSIGLVNTYAGVIIPGLASIFGIFLIRQYASSIPDSLIDAARLDGASEWSIYRRLVLPLCRPILATLGIFTFMGVWNDFLWPLIVLSDNDLYTLPVALSNLMGEHAQDTELMMAGAVLTVAPVLLVFLALQRYYSVDLLYGGIKE